MEASTEQIAVATETAANNEQEHNEEGMEENWGLQFRWRGFIGISCLGDEEALGALFFLLTPRTSAVCIARRRE